MRGKEETFCCVMKWYLHEKTPGGWMAALCYLYVRDCRVVYREFIISFQSSLSASMSPMSFPSGIPPCSCRYLSSCLVIDGSTTTLTFSISCLTHGNTSNITSIPIFRLSSEL